jgi:hypothetical protein
MSGWSDGKSKIKLLTKNTFESKKNRNMKGNSLKRQNSLELRQFIKLE